jgi:hypothetical protein
VWLVGPVPRETALQTRAHLIDIDAVRRVACGEHLHNAAGPKPRTPGERPIEVPHDKSIRHVLTLRTYACLRRRIQASTRRVPPRSCSARNAAATHTPTTATSTRFTSPSPLVVSRRTSTSSHRAIATTTPSRATPPVATIAFRQYGADFGATSGFSTFTGQSYPQQTRASTTPRRLFLGERDGAPRQKLTVSVQHCIGLNKDQVCCRCLGDLVVAVLTGPAKEIEHPELSTVP